MDRPAYYVTPQEIIIRGLGWCSKNKKYRNDTVGGKSSRAVNYNRAWVQLIRRIKDYIEDDNNKLIRFYDYLRNSSFDEEIKQIILRNLKKEGEEQELIYFMTQEEGQKLINDIFRP